MTNPEKPWETEAHWLTQELLARYSELLRAHIDASQIYPNVAAHLEQCEICRVVLEDLMAIGPEGESSDREDSSLQQAALSEHENSRQDIQASPSQTRLVVSLAEALDFQQAGISFWNARRPTPARSGGRLLFYDAIPLGPQQIVAKFTLYLTETPGRYLLAGELSGSDLSPMLSAYLYVDGEICYNTDVREGKLDFEDIPLDESVERIEIVLQLPD